jgi:DNA-binding GntR family transcriptional regulator
VNRGHDERNAVVQPPKHHGVHDVVVGTNTVIGLLEPHLAEPIAEAAQSITIAPADALVADAVGCRPGHPMLRVDRLYSDVGGRPVELSVSHFLPEQYTYRVTLRRSGLAGG